MSNGRWRHRGGGDRRDPRSTAWQSPADARARQRSCSSTSTCPSTETKPAPSVTCRRPASRAPSRASIWAASPSPVRSGRGLALRQAAQRRLRRLLAAAILRGTSPARRSAATASSRQLLGSARDRAPAAQSDGHAGAGLASESDGDGPPRPACVVHRISQRPYRGLFETGVGPAGVRDRVAGRRRDDLQSTEQCPGHGDRLGDAGTQQHAAGRDLRPEDRARVQSTFDQMAEAIAAYEGSPEVSAFSSKFDAFLAGTAQLTDAERRGYELFNGQRSAWTATSIRRRPFTRSSPTTRRPTLACRETPTCSSTTRPVPTRSPTCPIRRVRHSWTRESATSCGARRRRTKPGRRSHRISTGGCG